MEKLMEDAGRAPALLDYQTEESPWKEITVEHIRGIRGQLGEYENQKKWVNYVQLAAKMEKLGLNVKGRVQEYAEEIWEKYGQYRSLPNSRDWTPLLSDMHTLGLDTENEIETSKELMMGDYERYKGVYIDSESHSQQLDTLTSLGVDVKDEVKRYTPKMKETLRRHIEEDSVFGNVLRMAAQMKRRGIDVKDEVEERREIIQEGF